MSSGRCSGLDNITSHQPPRLLSLRKANLYDWLLLFAFSRSMTPNVRSRRSQLKVYFGTSRGCNPAAWQRRGRMKYGSTTARGLGPLFAQATAKPCDPRMRLAGFQLLCFISICSALTSWTVPDPLGEPGTQFIRYNVTITGTYTHPGTNLTQCGNNGTYDLHIGDDMPLYVGVNPPWDPNPFFFWFGRINFKTSAFICYQDGQPCASTTFWPWYYVHAQLLDLSRATVKVVQNSTGSMYRVTGDQGSFVSNGTEFDPALFFTAPTFPINQTRGTGMRDPAGCVLTESINW